MPAKAVKTKSPAKKKRDALGLVVVGIGASAGGLEAVSQLLQNLPPDTGMAYFYLQHLSPDHVSNLPQLLAAHSQLKVIEAKSALKIKANHLYVCTPNKEITIIEGRIKLIPRESATVPYLPINTFFKMIARQFGNRAIGVVLSGNATDGTAGLKEIKEKGGITFVQDGSAKYSSMPLSAMKGSAVDYVLSPVLIARTLARLGRHGVTGPGSRHNALEIRIEDDDLALGTIFRTLLKQTGIDFSHYKLSTIKRRLNYRMINCGIDSIEEYARLTSHDKKEVEKLHGDLLINVTSFFRDPDAFNFLKEQVFPKLLRAKPRDEPFRIWVPGCSTGEEAFTIAMILNELQEKKKHKTPIQIFATDLSAHAIREARRSEYSASDLSQLSEERAKKFFTPTTSGFRVNKEIREMCVFAPHNLLSDPPFSRMDFISCCNLLIYFDTDAQKKSLATLHFALNDSGLLMLGKSESVGSSSPYFSQYTPKFKIYSRKKTPGSRRIPELAPRFPSTIKAIREKPLPDPKPVKSIPALKSLEGVIDSILLSKHMPPCVLISKDMEILKFRGAVNAVLKHAAGNASLNLLKLAPPEASFDLANGVRNALKTGKKVSKTGIRIGSTKKKRFLSFEITPVQVDWEGPLLLVVFTLNAQKDDARVGKLSTNKEKDRLIKRLQDELESTRHEMHSFIESQEVVNAELQTANEEIVSTNEEFQTLNEELETSKEEMQATNEELISTNQELQMRNDLLSESYSYSEAIIATIHEPMVVLDSQLTIKSANESFYKKFKVTKKETVGVSLYELGNSQWDIPALRKMLGNILLKNSEFQNLEIRHTFPVIGYKVMLLNAHRIIQKTHGAWTILLAIEDITERYLHYKKEKEELRKNIRVHEADKAALERAVKIRTRELGQKNIELEALVKYATMGILVVDEHGKIVRTNPCLDNLFGYTSDELIGQVVEKLIPKRYVKRHMVDRENYKVNPHAREMGAGRELFGMTKDGTEFPVEISLSPYSTSQGNFVISFVVDITVRKQSEELILERTRLLEHKTAELREKNLSLEKMNKELETFTFVSSHDLQEPLRKIKNFTTVLLAEESEAISESGKKYLQRTHETANRMQSLIGDLLAYSRSKKPEKIFEPVKLSQLTDNIKETFSDKLRDKQVSLLVLTDCTIDVIRFQFRQLLQNLVGNSIKFADSSRPLKITLNCEILSNEERSKVNLNLSEKTEYCHIVYTDTGIGFSSLHSERIFEVFQRLHSQETYAGTGMGLAICKRIVENHDGAITASGKEGEGARFDLYIPSRQKKAAVVQN